MSISFFNNHRAHKNTPESITLGSSSGIGATCCAVVSLDEAASSAINPTQQAYDADHISNLYHIPTRSEAPLTAVAGYLSAGGIVIADQIARDHASKQKGLMTARKKVLSYNVQNPKTNAGKAQCHAKAAFSEMLTARVKRARFERFVNGRMSQVNSGAILAGQFVPLAQTVGLAGLSIASFANVFESYKELRESQQGLARCYTSHYDSHDDSAIRAEAFREKNSLLRGNIASMAALGVGAGINAAADIFLKVAPAGLGLLPGLGTVVGLPTLLGGVLGSIVFNNKKNNDAHGATLSHELIHGITQDDDGDISSLMTHQEVCQNNIAAWKKRNTLNDYRNQVYAHRGRGTLGKSFGCFMVRAEHGALRWGHKAMSLLTLGLIPQITSLKDNVRDRVLHRNTGEDIDRARLKTLLSLEGAAEVDQLKKANDYSALSTKDKLTTLLNTVRNTPSLSGAIEKKFLSRLVEIDTRRGTYNGSDGKTHSFLKLKPYLRRDMTSGNKGEQKSLNDEVRAMFEKQPSRSIFGVARTLANKGERVQEVLLRELQIATDHILMFSAHKDARREIIVYSQLSDAFEKTKQQNSKTFSYEATQETFRPTTQSSRINSLCTDPSCFVPHKPARVAPLPPLPAKSQPFSMDFCMLVSPS